MLKASLGCVKEKPVQVSLPFNISDQDNFLLLLTSQLIKVAEGYIFHLAMKLGALYPFNSSLS